MTAPFAYIDPGPLIDDDLELVAPEGRWLDHVMAAQQHPTTLRETPSNAQPTRQHHLDFIRRAPGGFEAGDEAADHVPSYYFWMRCRPATDYPIVGGIGLRLGHGPNIERIIGHIGYHVYPFARGHHYAERACRLLLPLARQHGLIPLWITCNPDNLPSRRTCERLGATLVETVPVPPSHPLYARGERHKCRYKVEGVQER